MAKKTCAVVLFLLVALAIVPAFAGRPKGEELQTARAEVAVIPTADMRQAAPVGSVAHSMQDFRDSAALVLVGGMLIGLAAAVRRTV